MRDKTGLKLSGLSLVPGRDAERIDAVLRSGFVEKYSPMVHRGYRADFSRDTRIDPPVFHYIISRDEDTEILVFAQAHTLEAAQVQALNEIEALSLNDRGDNTAKAQD